MQIQTSSEMRKLLALAPCSSSAKPPVLTGCQISKLAEGKKMNSKSQLPFLSPSGPSQDALWQLPTASKLRTPLVRMNKQKNITRHMKRCRSSKAEVHFEESEKVPALWNQVSAKKRETFYNNYKCRKTQDLITKSKNPFVVVSYKINGWHV